MIKVGLTGSIGMGKSTTAQLFADHGCDVWDADAVVHRLYAKNGKAVDAIQAVFPEAIKEGEVDRKVLRRILRAESEKIETLNSIVHPLVAEDRTKFTRNSISEILVFDIPLLFENRMDDQFDVTVCVLTSPQNQRERVLARGTMTEEDLDLILSKQLSAKKKAALADHIVRTDDIEEASKDVSKIVRKLKETGSNA